MCVCFFAIRTQLLKRIYDDYDLNIKMHDKPVGFTLKTMNNESNNIKIILNNHAVSYFIPKRMGSHTLNNNLNFYVFFF